MKDLTQGSVTKHLLHMSAFMAVSMIVQTLYLLADLFWVGHLGKEAIAAVGVAGNLNMFVLAITQMLGVGTTALISQAAGRKDQAHAELVFNQSCVMSIWIALALLDQRLCQLSERRRKNGRAGKSLSLLVHAGFAPSISPRGDGLGVARDRNCSGAGRVFSDQRRS